MSNFESNSSPKLLSSIFIQVKISNVIIALLTVLGYFGFTIRISLSNRLKISGRYFTNLDFYTSIPIFPREINP